MTLLLLGLLAAGAAPPPFPGNDHSYGLSASRDLRYVAFTSNASNLVPGDTNGQPDVFVADRQTGSIVRASVDADGIQGNGQSAWPSLSADGRYVAFDTGATNLGPQGPGLVRKDLLTGAVAQGAVRSGYSPSYPSISDDGRYAATDPGGVIQSHDFETGATVDVTTGGFFEDAHPVVSGDGRWVFFASNRANLVANDTNGASDIFRWDRTDPSSGFERVSLGAGGVEANGASPPFFATTRPTRSPRPYAVTPSGSHILFASNATNLVAGQSTGGLVGRNIDNGATIRVGSCTSCNAFGGAFDSVELSSDISFGGFHAGSDFEDAAGSPRAAGYYRVEIATATLTPIGERGPEAVVFDSPYSMVVSDDGASYALQSTLIEPGVDDRARYGDVLAGTTGAATRTLVSRGAIGRAGDGHSRQPALSDDGRVVAFASDSTHLAGNDDNGQRDVYVRDYAAGTVVLASAAADGTPGDGPSSQPSLSGNGAVVAFHSTASNLVPGAVGGNIFVRVLATGEVERVSGATPGQALGPSALSLDGRWVAYSTAETVQLYDRVEDTTVLASPTRDGTAPNETCNLCEAFPLSISDDGRYVAFNARATNHAPGQSNNVRDVLVFDRDAGTVELISRGDGANGTEATADSVAPSISGDGRYVAWYAFGPGGLVPGAPSDTSIFLRDRVALTTTAVGAAPPLSNFFGTEPRPTVSRDGRSVAFVSRSARLVEGDTNALPDLYVWSREDGTTTRASLSAARSQADGSAYAYDLNLQGHPRFFAVATSRDGGTVAFSSAATNLGVGDANGADDVFVVQRDSQAVAAASQAVPPPTQRDLTAPVPSLDGSFALMVGTDRAGAFGGAPVGPAGDAGAKGVGNKWSSILAFDFDTGEESQIDVATGGDPANGDSYNPSLAADEPIAAFTSDATNLGTEFDGNGRPDVFVRDLDAGVTVSLTAGADGDSGRSATSSIGGKWMTAFESSAGNLPGAASANGVRDVFVAAEGTSEHTFTLRPVSVALGGGAADGASGDPALTRSGRYAAFSSLATNLVASDANAASDVFVRDLVTNTTVQVSATGGGTSANGASGEPAIVDLTGGKWAAAYESDASDIVAGDANNDTDVFLRTSDGAIELVSRGLGGAPANGKSGKPSLSPDGRYVAFVSTANNLVAGDTNNAPDVFLYDRVTQATTRVSARPAAQANGHSLAPAVAMRAGSVPVVVFDTAADNLVPGDDDDALDVYRYDAEDQSLLGTDALIFRNGFE